MRVSSVIYIHSQDPCENTSARTYTHAHLRTHTHTHTQACVGEKGEAENSTDYTPNNNTGRKANLSEQRSLTQVVVSKLGRNQILTTELLTAVPYNAFT